VTYTQAAALGVLAALVLDLAVLRTRLVLGVAFWAAYPVVLVFQLLANGVLTGLGVVRYDPHAIIGARLAYAPVEDLAFGFALVLSTLSVWVRLGAAARVPSGSAGAQRGGAGQLGEYGGAGRVQGCTGQRSQRSPGQLGDTPLGTGQRPGTGDDLA